MSVGAVSSLPSYAYYPPMPVTGVEEEFAVQPSALREDAVAASEQVAQAEASTFVDPAEAAKFSRDFPQILMQGAFAAPILETEAPTAAEAAGDVSLNYLWQGDSIRPGGESGEAVAGATELAAPGDDNREEPVIESGENAEDPAASPAAAEAESEDPAVERNAAGEPMSEEEQAQVQELRDRDREVRVHEQAHQAAGGQYASGATYEFQQGPDGQRYAVGGEVSIDTSPERTPEATISKMQQVRAAALAPAEPSGPDRAVAASAQAAEMEARSQVAEQRAAESAGADSAEEGEAAKGVDETAASSPAGEAAASSQTRPDATGSVPSGEDNGETVSGVSATRSTNPFENAYRNQMNSAASGYGSRFTADPIMASSMAYRPIDIVA